MKTWMCLFTSVFFLFGGDAVDGSFGECRDVPCKLLFEGTLGRRPEVVWQRVAAD